MGMLMILGIGAIIFFIIRAAYGYKSSRDKRVHETRVAREKDEKSAAEKEEWEDKQRAKIVRALRRIEKYVDAKHPPSEQKLRKMIKRRLGVDLDEELFEQEYLLFLDELDAKAKEKEDKEREKNIKKAEKAAAAGAEPQFCGECGAKLKPKDTFCGDCGAKMNS